MRRSACSLLGGLVLVLCSTASAFGNGYATDSGGMLYRVSPATEKFERLGQVVVRSGRGEEVVEERPTLTDIALSTSRGLYGISYNALYKIEITDPAQSKRIGELGGYSFNALAFDPEGEVLFAMSGDQLHRVDLESGKASLVGRIGSGGGSDGDLAFIGGVLYGTFSRSDGSHLMTIDPKTGKGREVGVIRRVLAPEAPVTPKKEGATPKTKPLHSVWGLIHDGHKTWALTADGHVLELDPKTAIVKPAFRTPLAFYGACPMLRL